MRQRRTTSKGGWYNDWEDRKDARFEQGVSQAPSQETPPVQYQKRDDEPLTPEEAQSFLADMRRQLHANA